MTEQAGCEDALTERTLHPVGRAGVSCRPRETRGKLCACPATGGEPIHENLACIGADA